MPQGDLAGIYRREGDWHLVEVKVSHPAQLFNSLDPSPFRERDLDAEAADYIVDAMRELHGARRVRLVIHLPAPADARSRTAIAEAIHNYFRYRALSARFALRQVLRLGRSSLLVGLAFLALCSMLWLFVFTGDSALHQVLHEGALIIGWVAMWRPLDLLLYEWWPILRDERLFRRISALPVDVRWPPAA